MLKFINLYDKDKLQWFMLQILDKFTDKFLNTE